jgi:hypothetical protein
MTPICPTCREFTIRRVHGTWCPRCRGWYVSYTKPTGEFMPYIRVYTYLP